ncbi:hypothetical protein CK203_087870 [Vitis vinifera]|uniref:DUF4283 domain-containing protein n=1 Tax=Vitis vinifera TaxID=29760 RepID=A0A438DQS5_VITVI|nr:hypothetical protein CK203_087870 [Vitis vinifera]
MWLTGGKNFLRMFIGVSNARVWDGILELSHYNAFGTSQPLPLKYISLPNPQHCQSSSLNTTPKVHSELEPVRIAQLVKANTRKCGPTPRDLGPMENPKGLAMEVSHLKSSAVFGLLVVSSPTSLQLPIKLPAHIHGTSAISNFSNKPSFAGFSFVIITISQLSSPLIAECRDARTHGERERESAREREGERGRESACDGDDEETGEASQKRSFTVESKTFELALEDRKGKCQVRVVEKKRGVSTWVRLGLDSLGLFKEGLIHCIRDEKEGRWEKEWKERGRRDKRGWTAMAEMVRQMEELAGRRTELQEVRTVGKITPAKSYAEAVRRTDRVSLNAIKMKVTREEIAGNLQKLEHCLVACWKSNEKEEDDLERLGSLWANSWGLKGKLGLAKLERGKALLEFEDISEAHRVVSSGSRLMGEPIYGWTDGIQRRDVGLRRRWSRSMREIQWARILVKTKGDFRPSLLEMEVEDEAYTVALWWEIRPVVRRLFSATENRRKKEVRGDSHSRAEKRVERSW